MNFIRNTILAKNIISPNASQDDGIFFNATTGRFEARSVPAIAITDTYVVGSESEQLALSVQKGDVAIRTDISKSYVNSSGNNTSMSDWAELLSGAGVDELVKASASDPNAGYLDSKIDTTKMVMNGETISIKDYSIYPIISKLTVLDDPANYPETAIVYNDDSGIHMRTIDVNNNPAWLQISTTYHDQLLHITTDDHHPKTHDHSVASGSGAINTDQIAKFGDATNYTQIDATGKHSFYGSARYEKTIYQSAYNMYPHAGTYNGISCKSAGSAVIDNKWYARAFSDGTDIQVTAEAMITSFVLPAGYEEGTDIKVVVEWTAGSVDGDVSYGVGLLAVGVGEQYDGTETYITGTTTAPTTAYMKKTETLTFAGTGFHAGDSVALVLYRYGDDASDTMSGDAYVIGAELIVICNKIGGDVI